MVANSILMILSVSPMFFFMILHFLFSILESFMTQPNIFQVELIPAHFHLTLAAEYFLLLANAQLAGVMPKVAIRFTYITDDIG